MVGDGDGTGCAVGAPRAVVVWEGGPRPLDPQEKSSKAGQSGQGFSSWPLSCTSMFPGSVSKQGCPTPAARMAVNVAHHKIIHLLNTLSFFVFVSICVFNVWPETTPLPPVWPIDTERLDTPERII